jgi:hypothetical protein
MLWRTLSLACCLGIPGSALANDKPTSKLPVRVTVCELENHPNVYDRKLVEVSGRIYFGKFDFIIDATCKPHSQARVWLDIGGDVISPAQYWDIGNFLPKQRGVDVQVRGIAVPLVHDSLLDQFVNDVGATRFRKPNGESCGSECLFYDINATLRGVFFSAVKGGFGMEQCCHLLLVEKVTNLSSKRTSVPSGGTYQCTSDRWRPTPEELKALSEIPGCSLRANFKNCYPVIAKHWGETIKANAGLGDRGWISPDMTDYYEFAGGFTSKAAQPKNSKRQSAPVWESELAPSSSFVREVCRITSPPHPASDHIYCGSYRSYQSEDRNGAMAVQGKVDAGQETWRASDMAQVAWLAYEQARKQWSIDDATQAKLSKCEPWLVGKDGEGKQQQWGYCTWFTPDDMQEITVQLHKPGYLEKPGGQLQNVAWIATDVEVNLCHTNPSPQ